MRQLKLFYLAGLACLVAHALAGSLRATTVDWTINQQDSTIALSFNKFTRVGGTLQNATILNQAANGNSTGTSWTTGNTAEYGGTIATNYQDGASIQFLTGQSSIAGVTSTVAGFTAFPDPSQLAAGLGTNPNPPGGNGSSATALYGGYLEPTTNLNANIAPFAVSSLALNIASGVLPISGGSFAASGTSLGVPTSTFGAVFPGAFTITPGPFTSLNTSFNTADQANSGATASITNLGGSLRELTISINIPITVQDGGFTMNGFATGTIVATASVPEPGSGVLAICGVVGMSGLALARCRKAAVTASQSVE